MIHDFKTNTSIDMHAGTTADRRIPTQITASGIDILNTYHYITYTRDSNGETCVQTERHISDTCVYSGIVPIFFILHLIGLRSIAVSYIQSVFKDSDIGT